MARTVPFLVELEDGATWDVVVDQRDIAAWEMQDFYDDERTTVRMRYTAFNASSRTAKTNLSWPKFNAACVSVTFNGSDSEADEADAEVPPTQPDPSGAP